MTDDHDNSPDPLVTGGSDAPGGVPTVPQDSPPPGASLPPASSELRELLQSSVMRSRYGSSSVAGCVAAGWVVAAR